MSGSDSTGTASIPIGSVTPRVSAAMTGTLPDFGIGAGSTSALWTVPNSRTTRTRTGIAP